MKISDSDADYYTAQLSAIESRLHRSVACGWDNDSAHANLKHELRDDLAAFRAQIKTRIEETNNPTGYAPLAAWIDRMETTRRDALLEFHNARRSFG